MVLLIVLFFVLNGLEPKTEIVGKFVKLFDFVLYLFFIEVKKEKKYL